jgi:hypothetical protein
MSQMTVVKEAVKETLVGHEEATQMSAHTKAHFLANAAKDPQTGELFMGPDEFITAVAPKNDDFVSSGSLPVSQPPYWARKSIRAFPLVLCHVLATQSWDFLGYEKKGSGKMTLTAS